MKEKVEVVTYLEGLKTDYDEYYASLSKSHPFRKDLLSNPKPIFSLFQPERLSEMGSEE